MTHRLHPIVIALALLFAGGLASVASAQITPAANPVPPNIRPQYNYSEAFSCTSCHFVMGTNGDHNLEAVGVSFDDTNKVFNFTGGGWLSAKHSQSNERSTQNTFCSKCHAPLQADPTSTYKNGVFTNTKAVADGATEGVTCSTCHPSHTVAAQLGRRLGIYQWGKDRNTAEAYKVVAEGGEDQLCLNCHITRHNTTNPAFLAMYQAGVRCIDCHMSVTGAVAANPAVPKRAHDWKVAKNLPYSCGVEGSVVHCHPGFTTAGTLAFIPFMKEQHQGLPWPNGLTPGTWKKPKSASSSSYTASDFMSLWQYLDAQARAQGQ